MSIWEFGRKLGHNKVTIKENDIFVEELEDDLGNQKMIIKLNNFSVLTDPASSNNPLVFDIGNDSVRIENGILVSRDAAERLGILKQLDSGLRKSTE